MKRFLIVCGVILALIVALVGVEALRFFLFVKRTEARQKNLNVRYEALNHQFPFSIPSDGRPEEERLITWIRVNNEEFRLMDYYETHLYYMFAYYDSFVKKVLGLLIHMREAMNSLFKFEEGKAQALEDAAMSGKEYMWITRQVTKALAGDEAQNDPAFRQLSDAVAENRRFALHMKYDVLTTHHDTDTSMSAIQERHVLELLRKHEKKLKETNEKPEG